MRIYSHSHECWLSWHVHCSGRTVWGRLRRKRGFRSNHPSCPPPPLSRFLSLLQSFTCAWWRWCHHPSLFLSPTFFLCIFWISLDMVPLAANDRLEESKQSSRFFFSFLDWIPLFHSFWLNFLESFKELEFLLHILDVCVSVCVCVCVCVWLLWGRGWCLIMAHAASQIKKNKEVDVNALEDEKERKKKSRKHSKDQKKKVHVLTYMLLEGEWWGFTTSRLLLLLSSACVCMC